MPSVDSARGGGGATVWRHQAAAPVAVAPVVVAPVVVAAPVVAAARVGRRQAATRP